MQCYWCSKNAEVGPSEDVFRISNQGLWDTSLQTLCFTGFSFFRKLQEPKSSLKRFIQSLKGFDLESQVFSS